jgi:hypothetical protein
MKTPEQIESLVRDAFAGRSGEFRPCAFFDDSLDCIRILTRDCSITETRVNNLITVLEATYPRGGRKCVGFTLKGARHFCKEHNLNPATAIPISNILDGIMASCPDVVVEAFVDYIARPLVREENIESVEPPLQQVPELQTA